MPNLGKFNSSGPIVVIGDIHGRIDHLERLCRKIPKSSQIVVVGDLIDRGPNSKEVIDFLIDKKAVGVMGNHEEWFLEWACSSKFEVSNMMMGAEPTLTSYGSKGKDLKGVQLDSNLVPKSHIEFISSLSIALDLQIGKHKYWVTHSGTPSNVSLSGVSDFENIVPWLAENKPSTLLWGNNHPEDTLEVDRTMIMGHMIQEEPKDCGFVIGIDTGCGTTTDGFLSAVLLPERRFISSI